ncbi:MAG: pantoate--beta-alanine ligase [Peptococcaceae bacterium]|nr:pantoate--beta-alanine ligase [Peptococcaceae bacterium]
MELCQQISVLRQKITAAKSDGKQVGLVPTMGYLHAGHQSLIQQARLDCDLVVVSIFVNPIQFGPNEDYATYPRDLERDSQMAYAAGADLIFAPPVADMYPKPNLAHVEVDLMGNCLCGRSRQGHFRGVATVVSKLFNIAQPHKAYFGKKDAQQLAIIKRMVEDLNFPIHIVAIPIAREQDGLAMSSRNIYLSPAQRAQAPVLHQALVKAQEMFTLGERSSIQIIAAMKQMIGYQSLADIDYIEIVDTETLQPVEILDNSSLLALAVRFGKTRLIDNITLGED